MIRNGLKRMMGGLVVAILMAGGLANAQTATRPAETQATQGKTIFDFRVQLNLTEKQERDMREVLADLNKELQVGRAKLTILSFELEDLIKKDGNLEQIRKNLKDQADLRANLRYADIVATRGINKLLSPEQLTRWKSIQASAR